MKNKRGWQKSRKVKKAQFYIIAAIIIVGVLFSIVAISTYIKSKPQPSIFYDLSKELDLESTNVINYGTYSGEDMPKLLENFSDTYASYAGEDTELILVYGTEASATAIVYSPEETGTISVDIGTGTPLQFTPTRPGKKKGEAEISGGKIDINVENVTYNFELNQGENFFFVLKKQIGEEEHVAT